MSGITLSSAMRSNLLSLQDTVKNMNKTQIRLSTGREVNEAIDSPYRYFTSNLLQSRADDLDTINKDLGLSAKTIQAANHGIESMLKLLEQAKSLLSQSLQESDGFMRQKYLSQYNEALAQFENIAEDAGYKGKNLLAGAGNDLKVIFNEGYTSQLIVQSLDLTDVRNVGLNKNMSEGTTGSDRVQISASPIGYQTKMVDIPGFAAGDEIEFVGLKQGDMFGAIEITDTMTVDEFMTQISVSIDNVEASLSATTGNIDFKFATEVAIRHLKEPNTALSGDEVIYGLGGGSGMTLGTPYGGNLSPSTDLANIMTIASGNSIDFTVTDMYGTARTTSFTYGVNGTKVQDFLDFMNDNADNVQLAIDYDSGSDQSVIKILTSSHVDATNATSMSIASTGGVLAAPFDNSVSAATSNPAGTQIVVESDFYSDSQLESLLLRVRSGEMDLRQQMTSFSTDLSVIHGRISFAEVMMSTLKMGASDLVEADQNEESVNMLALQTRQQLSNTALSIASQAEQSILRLFG